MENTEIKKVDENITAAPIEMRACYECEKEVSLDEVRHRSYRDYCESCYNEIYIDCEDCGDTIARDDSWEENGDMVCRSCYRDREERNSRDDSYHSVPARNWTSRDLPEFQNGDRGEIINSRRIFSAELEMYDHGNNIEDVADTIHKGYGISEDGSLASHGVEIQTPKLKGKAGEDAIVSLCNVLNKADMECDRDTGYHVHLDGADFIPATRTKSAPHKLKALFMLYLAYEDVMLSFLPPSRRRNTFCKLLANEYHLREVETLDTLADLEKLWYRVQTNRAAQARKGEKYDHSRYAGVNFHSLLKDGHLEIRYHSGTTNARKILEWINLHQRIMDAASESPSLAVNIAQNATAITDLREKTRSLYDFLGLTRTSTKYFDERQKLFTSTKADSNEDIISPIASIVNETPVCAA